MLDYKKIIKSQCLRFKILKWLSWVPDGIMIRVQYRIKMGYWPDLKHPKRYSEKLQVYKMKYRNPLMHQCVDKYEVRKYVESKGLGAILNELYGVYNYPEDIIISLLPQKFVAKTTDGSGGQDVMIVRNKADINVKVFKAFFQSRMDKNLAYLSREWAYSGIKNSRVIVEKLLEGPNYSDDIEDYKFLCFNGKFRVLWIDKERYTNHTRGFWNRNLDFMPEVSSDYPTLNRPCKLPDNIHEMISVAEKLSEDFPHVRVDLYNVGGKIVFGELTFYPLSGYVKYKPETFDLMLGEYFTGYDRKD